MRFFEICLLTPKGYDITVWHNEWPWGAEALGNVWGNVLRKNSALLRVVELPSCPDPDCKICAVHKDILSRVESRNA